VTGRLLSDLPQSSLEEHLKVHGPPPFADTGYETAGGDRLITAVEQSGLAGRGGAGFPAGRKMRAVAEAGRHGGPFRSAVGTTVIANGAESEPTSGKDRELLARVPHLVLDGLVLAAEAVGATQAYLCQHGDPRPLADAVASRERAGLNRVPVQVVTVPPGYVSGQETALVSHLNGAGPRPTFVPPRPAERGVRRHPTLVQNVETLASLALIARHGPGWFRSVGPPYSPGTALVTVSGAVASPGVYEIALGTPLDRVLAQAGGWTEAPQAVLAGGYFGGWLPLPAAAGVELTDVALRAAGATFGPGVLVALPASACPLAETARVTSYLASQSAGQCGPCSNGLPALAQTVGHVAFGRPGPGLLHWTRQLLALVSGRGACHLPDGAAGLVASTLAVFAAEVSGHGQHGPCPRVGRDPVVPVPAPPPGGWPPREPKLARVQPEALA
jgi:NADH:ubiquinone oxidoreductase subunit F (NADH-binding)